MFFHFRHFVDTIYYPCWNQWFGDTFFLGVPARRFWTAWIQIWWNLDFSCSRPVHRNTMKNSVTKSSIFGEPAILNQNLSVIYFFYTILFSLITEFTKLYYLLIYRYQRFGYAFFPGVPSRWSWTAGIQIRWKFRYHTHWWNRSWKSASTCIPLVGMIFEFPLNLDSRRSRPFHRNTIKNSVAKSLISMNWQNKNLWLKFDR